MKTYIDAKLQIVRATDDIVTASVRIGDPFQEGDYQADAPRRRSIWD
jgi:hypothetical protein